MTQHFNLNKDDMTSQVGRFAAILLLVVIFLTSCYHTSSKYKFGVTLYGGRGASKGFSIIYCDSVQMTSLSSADVWVDGIKIAVKADERISVWSNGN